MFTKKHINIARRNCQGYWYYHTNLKTRITSTKGEILEERSLTINILIQRDQETQIANEQEWNFRQTNLQKDNKPSSAVTNEFMIYQPNHNLQVLSYK
jgi:hypothetical protein